MTSSTRLPDGSVAVVEPSGHNASLISREVDGRCVWGQAFSCGPSADHDAQLSEVLYDMASRPHDFFRWWNA